ncbi:Hypp4311 [Branchiostoma lanceolatum]|uniref:Hypp3390 protein n=1 Tax=Branchiostoma lanceolatum TaxID=7740 RepID=A0A8K0EX59_BRALA|nr:Hypp3390 [Branchiostoma lanceolatum]CAH1270314.1 Hypp4311 [Branchiostoma lanceolatum]
MWERNAGSVSSLGLEREVSMPAWGCGLGQDGQGPLLLVSLGLPRTGRYGSQALGGLRRGRPGAGPAE